MRFYLFLVSIFFILAGQANELPEWKTFDIQNNLYTLREEEISTGIDFDQANKRLLDSINSYSPDLALGRAPGISFEQARQLLQEADRDNNELTSQSKFEKSNVLGLCFGRSIFFHLMLLRYGVNKDSIKKIFVIGPMSGTGDVQWQFHTATIVKDTTSGRWWALDTTFSEPLSVDEWIRQMKRRSQDTTFRIFRENLVDKTKSLRFYITQPEKIGPSGWKYNIKLGGLFDPFYNGYFKDIFELIKKKNISPIQKFNYGLKNKCDVLFSD